MTSQPTSADAGALIISARADFADRAATALEAVGRPSVILSADAATHDGLKQALAGDLALSATMLVLDAAAGVDEAARRAAALAAIVATPRLGLLIDGMDDAFFEEEQYRLVLEEMSAVLEPLGLSPTAAAPHAGALADAGESAMAWRGEASFERVVRALFPARAPFRFWVEDARRETDGTVLTGRVVSGAARAGDTLLLSPSNVQARMAEMAPDGATIRLGSAVLVERGELASHRERPPVETDVVPARIMWTGAEPLVPGRVLTLETGTLSVPATLEAIDGVLNDSSLDFAEAEAVAPGDVADVVFSLRRLIAIDDAGAGPHTGRISLSDERGSLGGGLVSMRQYADQRGLETRRATNITPVSAAVSPAARQRRNGHRGGVIWLTGLSGSGKSTLAMALEKRLFERGFFTHVLDGDNIRYGLSSDLGFSPEDRAENIRRVGEVAALFAQAGVLVITSFISPYRSDRARARRAAGDAFHEVFIDASLDECERRDPKGLYARARAGEIRDFTGVSAPYEPPKDPEFAVKTERRPVEACVDDLYEYVANAFQSAS